MIIQADLRALISALPLGWLTAPDMQTVVRRLADANPEVWLSPVNTQEAAAFLGVTAAALRQRRARGDHPDTWCPKSRRYVGGRLALCRWLYRNIQTQDHSA